MNNINDRRLAKFVLGGLLAFWVASTNAAPGPVAEWAAGLDADYRVVANVTYLTATGHESKLDLYLPRDPGAAVPTVLYFHGGGWVRGTKEANVLRIVPYLERGWAVANVEYRLGSVAPAPAAVEDGRCALRWVVEHAAEYGFDTAKIVVTGNSAGGHLALTTGLLPESAGLDRLCPGAAPLPRVAAIVDWYGITDVNELLDGNDRRDFAVAWLGSTPDRDAIARRVSPLGYVRSGAPPILMVHGDADPIVPYEQAQRLKAALDAAGVPNELVTVPGGKHGGFTRPEYERIFDKIDTFLRARGL